jgi:hypothetical protein
MDEPNIRHAAVVCKFMQLVIRRATSDYHRARKQKKHDIVCAYRCSEECNKVKFSQRMFVQCGIVKVVIKHPDTFKNTDWK